MTGTFQSDFEPGARWTFVHSSGKRTAYEYEKCVQPGVASTDPKLPGLTPTHTLRNPETGKLAYVTEKWMREGRVGDGRHGYWELDRLAEEALAA